MCEPDLAAPGVGAGVSATVAPGAGAVTPRAVTLGAVTLGAVTLKAGGVPGGTVTVVVTVAGTGRSARRR